MPARTQFGLVFILAAIAFWIWQSSGGVGVQTFRADGAQAGLRGDVIEVGGRSTSLAQDASANTVTISADAETYTGTWSITLRNPSTTDDAVYQLALPLASTITRVSCATSSPGTSITVQLDERAESVPNAAGTDVLSSPLVCDSDTEATTAFDNAEIAATGLVGLDVDAASGTPDALRVHIAYTYDD